jgi:ubiquinone biosynthesis protein COQ4
MWFMIRAFYYLVRLAISPGNYSVIKRFREHLHRHGYIQICMDHIRRYPEIVELLKERPNFDKGINFDELAALPDGTLGRAYVDFMRKHGLTPLEQASHARTTDEEYVFYWLVQTHDLWHVTLNCDIDVPGEMKIQAFMLSQLRWPSSAFFIGAFILRQMFKTPRQIVSVFEALVDGWTCGKHMAPLMAVRWDREWTTPLEEFRARITRSVPNIYEANQSVG